MNSNFKDWLELDNSPKMRGVIREKEDKPDGVVLPKQEKKLLVVWERGQNSQRLLRVKQNENRKCPLNLVTWNY